MSDLASISSSISSPPQRHRHGIRQMSDDLFNKIDTSGDGTINQTEMEQAVTQAGGTQQSADALFAALDPNNTGSLTQQQFVTGFSAVAFAPQTGSQLIAAQAQSSLPASDAASSDPATQLKQNLFSQLDADGDGSLTQSELEKAVTAAGGNIQSADALYAQLDPNGTGSVSEQQFVANFPNLNGAGPASASDVANGAAPVDALTALLQALTPAVQFKQNLFSKLDADGDGSLSKSELETAVVSTGGNIQAADALYAQLDPNGTGSVSEHQFVANFPDPTSAPAAGADTGATAQDGVSALLAGLNPASVYNDALFSALDSNQDGTLTKSELESAVTAAGGTSAQADALYAKLDPSSTGAVDEQQFAANMPQHHHHMHGFKMPGTDDSTSQDPDASTASTTGAATTAVTGTAQDAISALLQSIGAQTQAATGNGTSSAQASVSAADGTGPAAQGNSVDDAVYTLLNSGALGSSGGVTGADASIYASLFGGNLSPPMMSTLLELQGLQLGL